MMTVKEITECYKQDLILVEKEMERSLKTNIPSIYMIGMHLLSGGGKRLRPLLVILSSKLAGYNGKGDNIILANIIETIHTASLLHDDVVDSAKLRRGKPPANSIWGNQVVILVGDFLYSNALWLAASLSNLRIIETLSMTISGMTKGELLQLQKSGDIGITEEEYLKIIEGKTAILMSAACRVGSIIGNLSEDKEKALTSFGLKLGLTFQLVDDVLDFKANESKLGKNPGNDLREGRITYPLIHLLGVASPHEKKRIKEMVLSDEITDEDLSHIIHLLNQYMSIDKTYEKARSFMEEAKSELDLFDDSPEKYSLLAIADYSLNREY